jgi:hypothetical protein
MRGRIGIEMRPRSTGGGCGSDEAGVFGIDLPENLGGSVIGPAETIGSRRKIERSSIGGDGG